MKRRIIIILIVVGILGGLTAGTWLYLRRSSGLKLLARAELAIQADKLDKAVDLAEKYISKYPDDWRGYRTKAQAFIRLGRYDDARTVLAEAGRLNPTEVSISITLAESYSLPANKLIVGEKARSDTAVLAEAIKQFNQANEILLKVETTAPKHVVKVQQFLGMNYYKISIANRTIGDIRKQQAKTAEASRDTKLAAARLTESQAAFAKSDEAAEQAIGALLEVITKDASRPVAARVLVDLCIQRGDEKSLSIARTAIMALKSPPPIPAMRLALHDLSDKTETASRRERLDKLCKRLDAILKEHPDEPEVKLARANVALMLGDIKTAERISNEILKKNPRHGQALFVRAKLLILQRNTAEAERILFRLMPKSMGNKRFAVNVHIAYAQAAHALGKKDSARDAMRKIVTKINPDHALARRYLAKSLMEDGFYEQALIEAQDYYRSHPDDPVAVSLLVESAKRTDQPELARKTLEKVFTDDLSEPVMLMVIADGYKLLADRAKAQQALRKAAECKSDTAGGLFAIARAMRQVGRSPEAEKILLAELARDPEQSRVCFELGQCYLATGRVMQAIKQFRAALRIDSRNTGYRMALASAMYGIGDLEQCMNVLEQVDKSNVKANCFRLQVKLDMGQPVSAEQMLQQVQGAKQAGLYLAMIYLNNGRMEQCVEVCLAGLKKTPYDRRLRIVLGQAYLAQGHKKQCLKEWSAVLEATPEQLPTYLRITGVLSGKLAPKQVKKALALIPNAREDMIDLSIGWLFSRMRNFDAAVGTYTQLINRAKTSGFIRNRARLLRAKALAASGKHERAVAELDELSKNEAWYGLATRAKVDVLIKAGQIDKASDALTEVSNIAIKKKDSVALRRIALLYARFNKIEEALAVCNQLEILFPIDARAYLLRARVLSMGGRSSETFPLLEKAISLQPDNLRTHRTLALALEANQQLRQALETLKRMEKQSKSGLDAALYEQGHFFARWGLYAQSIECFRKLAAQGHTSIPKLQLALGRAFVGLGQRDQAREVLKNISSYSPQYVPAQQLMAEIAETDKEKLEILSQAEKAKPDHAGVLIQKMKVLLDADKPDEAVKVFHSFVGPDAENRPMPAEAAYLAIRAMLAADDREAASKLASRVAKDAPVPPWRQLAILLNLDNKSAVAKVLPGVEKADLYDAMLGLVLSVQNDDEASIRKWADRISQMNRRLVKMPISRAIPSRYRLLVALAAGRVSQAETELKNYKSAGDISRDAAAELVSLARKDAKAAIAEATKLLKALVATELGLAPVGKSWAMEVLKARPKCQCAVALVLKSKSDPATLKVLLETIRPADCVLARMIRASLLMHEGEYGKAAEVYRKAAEADKENHFLVLAQATATEKAGRLKEALSLYRKVWQATQNPVSGNNAAYLVTQLYPEDAVRLKEALQWTEAAIKTAPRAFSFRDTSGWVCFRLGKKEQALLEVRRAVKGLPNSPEVHYHMGVIEADAGNRDLGRWHLEAAVSSADAIKAGGNKLTVAEAKAARLAKEALAEGSPSEK